jgi:hypothetical protein
MKVKLIIAAFSILVAAPVYADKPEIGCGLESVFGNPVITFSGAIDDVPASTLEREKKNDTASNFMSASAGVDGMLSVEIMITGNENTHRIQAPFYYSIVGDRLEANSIMNTFNPSFTMSELKEHFGAFPEMKCYVANL